MPPTAGLESLVVPSTLPSAVRIGMEYQRRGRQAPQHIQSMTQEYFRRGKAGPKYIQDQGTAPYDFDLTQRQMDQRSADRFEDIAAQPVSFTDQDRRDWVDNQEAQWLDGLLKTYQQQPGRDPNTQLTYDQRSQLYRSIPTEQYEKKRSELEAQFDFENVPEARWNREREEFGSLIAQGYRANYPEATDPEVFQHMHQELARIGYNPSFAGPLDPVIDKKDLMNDLAAIQAGDAPLVDQAPLALQPVVAAAGGFVKSFQDSLGTFVGTLGAGGISEFLERTVGDDLGFRDQQAAIELYWNQRAGENFAVGTSRQAGKMGSINRFTEIMGGVAGDLAQTMVASTLGAGGAKMAGLSARITKLSAQLAGMGFMGVKEGGGAYRTIYAGLKAKGYSHEEANRRALYGSVSVGVVNALLEKAPLDAFLFANSATVNRFTSALRGFVVEGGQEMAQELVNVLAEFESGASSGEVVSWDNAKRLLMAGLAGGIVGGALGGVQGGQGALQDIEQQVQVDAANQIAASLDRAKANSEQRRSAVAGKQTTPDADGDAVVTPEKTTVRPKPPAPTGVDVKPPSRRDPKIIATSKQMGQWYAKTFDDKANAGAIEAMISTVGERYRLVDIPMAAVETTNIGAKGEIDTAKVDQISKLSQQEIADLPPIITMPGTGTAPLQVIDGTHRLTGLRQRGDTPTIRGYVPESIANQIAAGTLQTATQEGGGVGEGGGPGVEPTGPVPPAEGGEAAGTEQPGKVPPDDVGKARTKVLITRSDKAKLRKLGYGEDEIRRMRPEDAGEIIESKREAAGGPGFEVEVEKIDGGKPGGLRHPAVRNLKVLAVRAAEAGDAEQLRVIRQRLKRIADKLDDPYGVTNELTKNTIDEAREMVEKIDAQIDTIEIGSKPDEPTEDKRAVITKEQYREQRGDQGPFHNQWVVRDAITGEKLHSTILTSKQSAISLAKELGYELPTKEQADETAFKGREAEQEPDTGSEGVSGRQKGVDIPGELPGQEAGADAGVGVEERVRVAEEAVEREYDLARTDELTGIGNLRAANEQMEDLAKRADKEGKVIALGGIDLVLFKQVNDVLGHETGNRALIAASQVLDTMVRQGQDGRPGDVFGVVSRLGGDEFEFALYDVTVEQAQMVGRRLQDAYIKAMADEGIVLPGGLKTLLGFGLSMREPGSTATLDQLRKEADKDLESRKAKLKADAGLPATREEAIKIIDEAKAKGKERDEGAEERLNQDMVDRANRELAAGIINQEQYDRVVKEFGPKQPTKEPTDAVQTETETETQVTPEDQTEEGAEEAASDDDAVEQDITDPNAKMWIYPPPEGLGKAAKAKHRALMAKKVREFEAIGQREPRRASSGKKPTKALPPPKPARPKDQTGRLKSIFKTTGRDAGISGVVVDQEGNRITAADGHTMVRVNNPTGQSWADPGVYSVDRHGKLGPDPGDRTKRVITEMMPDVIDGYIENRGHPTGELDVAQTINRMRKLKIISDEGVVVVINTDGSLGFASSNPKTGTAEINVQDGYTELPAGVAPDLMRKVLEIAYANGHDTLVVYANNVVVGNLKSKTQSMPFIFEQAPDSKQEFFGAVAPIKFLAGVPSTVKAVTETKYVPPPERVITTQPGVGDVMGSPASTGMDPTSGKTHGMPRGNDFDVNPDDPGPPSQIRKPLPTEGGFTNDLDPLTQPAGKFRRQVSDKAKKIKAAIAKARARRDGAEDVDIDNIYKIISDAARRFNLGQPGAGRSRVLKRWSAGFYRPSSEATRLGKGSYVSTFVHELGHHVHKVLFPRANRPSILDLGKGVHHGKLSAYDFPKSWTKELILLGKDLYGDRDPGTGGYTSEGWAEVVRFLIVNPKHLKQRTPALYQSVVSTLTTHHPELWLALMDIRVRMINAANIAEGDPVDQFIAHKAPGVFDTLNLATLRDWFYTHFTNRFARLQTFKNDLGLTDMGADVDPHTLALRANGHISGDIKTAIEFGTFNPRDPKKTKTGKGLWEILEPVNQNLRKWQNYMVARRALEKRAQGFPVLPQDARLADQTSNARLREYIQRTEAQYPAFKQSAQEFHQFNQWLVGTYAVGHGLITAEVANLIIEKNLEYITFRYQKTEDALNKRYGVKSSKGGFTGRGSGIKRFTAGKGEPIVPPLESFFASMQGIMSNARLNQVALSVVGQFEKGVAGTGRWMDRIDRPMDAMKITGDELRNNLAKQLGINVSEGMVTLPPYLEDLNEDQMMSLIIAIQGMQGNTFWKPGNRTDRDNREVTVLVEGKPKFYEIKDAMLYNVLEGLANPHVTNEFVRMLGIPNRVLRAGATQYNPSFFIPNYMRDTIQALTMTDTELRKLPEQARLRIKGMKQAFLGGDIHKMFLASGADMSGIFGEYYNPLTQKLDFDQMFEKPRLMGLTRGNNVKAMVRDALRLGAIDRLNRSFEQANRLGEFAVVYEQAKRRGAGEAEAIAEAGQAAADITLDFSRGGDWSKQANEVIPFFNAAVIGSAKLGRFIQKNPGKAAGRIFTFAVLPSLLSMLLNWDNEDYWIKPRRMRDRYWYFPTGQDDNGGQTYIRLPKSYGLGAFSIFTERSFSRMFGIDPETGKRTGDRRAFDGAIQAIVNEFRPSINFAGIQPLFEVMAGDQGYSFWRDKEIVSSADKDLPLGEQGASRSSDLARVLGLWMDYPPAKIDYLIQGWGGGLARDTVGTAIDPIIRLVDPNAKKGEPIAFTDWLIVRRFLAGQTRSGHEAVSRFYDDYNMLKRINRGLTSREKAGDAQDLRDYRSDNASNLALWKRYSKSHRRMSDLFGQLRRTYRHRDNIEADALDERIDLIYEKLIRTARSTLQVRRKAEDRIK